jgi:hypothetical protein
MAAQAAAAIEHDSGYGRCKPEAVGNILKERFSATDFDPATRRITFVDGSSAVASDNLEISSLASGSDRGPRPPHTSGKGVETALLRVESGATKERFVLPDGRAGWFDKK